MKVQKESSVLFRWEVGIPILTNRFIMTQVAFALGIPALIVGGIVFVLYITDDSVTREPFDGWIYVILLLLLLLGLTTLIILAVYENRSYAVFEIDEKGIRQYPMKRTAKKNTIMNIILYKQLELIFDVTPILMAVSTISDGKFINVNKAWLDALEYNYDEVIGKSSRELDIFVDFADRQRVGQLILEHGVVRNQEIRIRSKTGRILTGLFSGDIITFGDEKFFLATAVDITDKKQTEDKMQKMEKLNLLGQMAAGISHEIRNPLSSIYGLLQLLKDKEGCSKYRKEFEIMITEILRANSVVDQFLSIGRDKQLKKDKHNINHILQKLYPLISSDAKRSDKIIKLELDDIPELLVDEGEIRQLILNMVRNGLESMEQGKCLTIKTSNQEDCVALSFKDEGKGVSPEIINRIGTPFFTTKENGTGLGLAICHRIIEHHNGCLKVDSGTNGTTFHVYLKI